MLKLHFYIKELKKKVYIKLFLNIFNLKSLVIMLNRTFYNLK